MAALLAGGGSGFGLLQGAKGMQKLARLALRSRTRAQFTWTT